MKMRHAAFALFTLSLPVTLPIQADDPVERGRYLVTIGGCNDCHTPGYPETAGAIPTTEWLTGSAIGFQGPWGTSYPTNLRLFVQGLDRDQWLNRVRQPMRPPMPWFNLRDMNQTDATAIYEFIRSLGARGESAPLAGAPGEAVDTAYIEFVPKTGTSTTSTDEEAPQTIAATQ